MVNRREFLKYAGIGITGLGIMELSDMAAAARGTQNTAAKRGYPVGHLPYRPYTLSPYDQGYVIEDVWPTIYFGDEAVKEIKRKAEKLEWAKRAVDVMKQEADMVMSKPPHLPVEPAGWRHDFYSRKTAEHLLYDPEQCEKFLDPSTGEYEYDEQQRRAWVLLTHERTYRLMRSLGILYRITGDSRYAEWTAEGMRRAVEYFTHKEFIRGESVGALYYQPLYDAAVLSMLAGVYSLIKDSSALSAVDHKDINAKIFQERMPDQVKFLEKHPTHNMSCYVSAALAYSGMVCENQEWTGLGLGDSSGLKTQLTKGLRSDEKGTVDGFWYEGTMFYHFYPLCPLVTLWEIDRQNGGKLSSDPDLSKRFHEMFAAPVSLADDSLRLPVVGDLGAPKVMNLAAYRHLYEYAAGQLDEERFAPILANIYRVSKAPRMELTALAFGPDNLPKSVKVSQHTVLPIAQTGVFRSDSPFPMYVMFRCGNYSGGHDHPDRLNVTLNAYNEVISPDLGTAGYSLHKKTHNYFRATIAHNTLFVDEKEQKGDAQLIWRPDADSPCARGIIEGEDGVTFRRTLFFSPPYLVMLDEYSSNTEHRFGWIYHAYGKVNVTTQDLSVPQADIPQLPALPEEGAFTMLSDRKKTIAESMLSADWQVSKDIKLKLTTLSDLPFEVTTCTTPGQPLPDQLGCILLRAYGKKRWFASVLEPYKNNPTIKGISREDDIIKVHLEDGSSKSFTWK